MCSFKSLKFFCKFVGDTLIFANGRMFTPDIAQLGRRAYGQGH